MCGSWQKGVGLVYRGGEKCAAAGDTLLGAAILAAGADAATLRVKLNGTVV
jgi:hypothetical protein